MVNDPWAPPASGEPVEGSAPVVFDPWGAPAGPAPAPVVASFAPPPGPVPVAPLPPLRPLPVPPPPGIAPAATGPVTSGEFGVGDDTLEGTLTDPAPVGAPADARPADLASLAAELAGLAAARPAPPAAPPPPVAAPGTALPEAVVAGLPDFVIAGAPIPPVSAGLLVLPMPEAAVAEPGADGPRPVAVAAAPAPQPAEPSAPASADQADQLVGIDRSRLAGTGDLASPVPAEDAATALDATFTVGGSAVPIPPGGGARPLLPEPEAFLVPPPAGIPVPPGGPVPPPAPAGAPGETATIAVPPLGAAQPDAAALPPVAERTAVPMPDLEHTASESTIVVGRHGPYGFLLRLQDGQGIPADRALLLGRRPVAEGLAGVTEPRLVLVDDPQRTVSRSHLLVEPVDGGILLRNVSAVNALVLVGPDGAEAEVEPGGAITVTGECKVILGAVPIGVERA